MRKAAAKVLARISNTDTGPVATVAAAFGESIYPLEFWKGKTMDYNSRITELTSTLEALRSQLPALAHAAAEGESGAGDKLNALEARIIESERSLERLNLAAHHAAGQAAQLDTQAERARLADAGRRFVETFGRFRASAARMDELISELTAATQEAGAAAVELGDMIGCGALSARLLERLRMALKYEMGERIPALSDRPFMADPRGGHLANHLEANPGHLGDTYALDQRTRGHLAAILDAAGIGLETRVGVTSENA